MLFFFGLFLFCNSEQWSLDKSEEMMVKVEANMIIIAVIFMLFYIIVLVKVLIAVVAFDTGFCAETRSL